MYELIILGQNNLVYFIAKMIACLPNTLLAPLVFMSIFQWITAPDVSFWKLYVVGLGIVVVSVCTNS
jgi:ABC-2 type transporter